MDIRQLHRYTGSPEQLFGLRRVQLQEGVAAGCNVIEATTAGGLQADILADTGLDLGLVRYKGVNAGFLSKNGYDSPARFLARERDFVGNFPGGLLYTCGLRSTGAPGVDGDEYHPQHGRIHGQPATNLSACLKSAHPESACLESARPESACPESACLESACLEGDELVIEGTMREAVAFGHMMELRRRISLPAWGSRIAIEDTIQNLTSRPEEFAILYHFNFGYPLLCENARLILPEDRKTTPRNEQSKAGLGHECEFSAPRDEPGEMVFFHELKEGWAKLENPDAGLAATLRWDLHSLPILAQWKNFVGGDYVLGLEPSNNYIMGRAAERENGTLQVIEAFGSVKTKLELEFESM